MLSSSAYKLLGSTPIVHGNALRLFLLLLHDYDLRNYTALPHGEVARRYGRNFKQRTEEMVSALLKIGILEAGPAVSGMQTYRVPRQFLMSKTETDRHYAMVREIAERESLCPSPVVERVWVNQSPASSPSRR